MGERLPPGAFHQFVPLDIPGGVSRFLDHWRPDLALFVESELWPNLVLQTRARGVPMALVNARLSQRSAKRWRLAPRLGRQLLSAFDECLAQNDAVASRLVSLGARSVRMAGNLKADAPPLPVDAEALRAFRARVGARPLFLAASTHPGEDELLLMLVPALKQSGALTIIVPRHPERGDEIEALAKSQGQSTLRRCHGALPSAETAVYVADTLGELGLFYRAAPFAFLGGSLVRHGGQNPLEPARLGTAVLTGPHTHNFADVFPALLSAQGLGEAQSIEDLRGLVMKLIHDPEIAPRVGAAAKAAAESLGGALAKTIETAERLLAHARS
jgi:3-deoxy-D-manno-octulosonic-acid transferase